MPPNDEKPCGHLKGGVVGSAARVAGAWLTLPSTQRVFEVLNAEGVRTRAVGGAVRNALLGHPAKDIDFATTALPSEVMAIARAAGMSVHPTGIAHGTVTIVCQDDTFEVTTLRKDVSTDGRRATVAFTSEWELDARRRDFTINALYCDGDGTLFDPLGGICDLEARKVRFIGDAHQRIREDYLRILRFFRFFATYSQGPMDAEGLAACVQEKRGIESLSGERIQSELLRLLGAPKAMAALAVMYESGILELSVGPVRGLDGVVRLSAIENYLEKEPDALLRLAAVSVYRPSDVRELTSRHKLSNAQARRLSGLVTQDDNGRLVDEPIADLCERVQRKALYRLGVQAFSDRALLEWARSGAPDESDKHRAAFELPIRWQAPSMPFSGAELIAHGFEPGPHIGKALSQFETWWVENDFPDERELLEKKLLEFANSA